MKRKTKSQKPHTANPVLEILLAFDEVFPCDWNTLLADETQRLFLADTARGKINRGNEHITLADARPSDVEEVTLKQALLWYVKCNPFSTSSVGSVELLCEMAAAEMELS